jgi:pseudaminic acid cytidylyltransferase
MSRIAIIPARGGSKRIPRKNIKPFLGKPIIAYSILSALSSRLFDEVMVSTDDQEIAEVAKRYGASVPFLRTPKNSDDEASTFSVLEEVIGDYKKQDRDFKYGCCIYPTAPFVTKAKLEEGFRYLSKYDFDSVFPVLRFSYPVQRALRLTDNRISMIDPHYLNSRSQDLEVAYHDSGQFYWFKVDTLLRQRHMFSANSGAIVISELEGQDIDSELDWKLAELKYEVMTKNHEGHE